MIFVHDIPNREYTDSDQTRIFEGQVHNCKTTTDVYGFSTHELAAMKIYADGSCLIGFKTDLIRNNIAQTVVQFKTNRDLFSIQFCLFNIIITSINISTHHSTNKRFIRERIQRPKYTLYKQKEQLLRNQN